MTGPMRVLVVDDEAAARRGLRRLLEAREGVEVAGEAGSADEAREAIRSTGPDIVLLDVRMPGESGLDALRSLEPDAVPAVVLVTAYDDHALEAFDVEAVDYLLKPYSDADFHRALDRACRRVRRVRAEALTERIREALGSPAGEGVGAPDAPERDPIPVRVGQRVRLLDPSSVEWVEADGDYVRLHAGDDAHLLRATMSGIADLLGRDRFVRIHRSTLVRIDVVREIRPRGSGRYRVVLRDGTERNVSRAGYGRLKEALGLER